MPPSAYLAATPSASPASTPPPSPTPEAAPDPEGWRRRLEARGFVDRKTKNSQGFSLWQAPDNSMMIVLPPANGKPRLLVGQLEVTAGQYRSFLAKRGLGEAYEPEDLGGFGDQKPVLFLKDFQAKAYAAWAECRIPTEAEWIRAARGDAPGDQDNRWPWGRQRPSASRGNYDYENNRFGKYEWRKWSRRVSEYKRAESPIGARQMAGNAAEYVDVGGGDLALKGGSWNARADSMQVEANPIEANSRVTLKGAGLRLFADAP